MRKIGSVAALLLAVCLTGCGAIPVAPSPAPSRTSSPPTPDAVAQETAYLSALRAQLPQTDFSSPGLWVDLGRAVCKAFDNGLTPKEVFDSMQGGAITEQQASAVVVISGIHLCPEYAPTP
ncbi:MULTISPECIES: DUF732 domain-containing protein [Microbacterium]|uniref:DUF732 domain-containing protein n=1 Tax=Microbacterium TaxID=33882 RepID=UPI00278A0F47|nr:MULTISPECIES: DUF732 domain-containing protein [Microbacterium]MDQ1083575.1 hypothetical protein [Microbacterium sp. SORGH_AS_0344]MDQ1171149.1 hypothetical protein [Microbacterium proteolyticum]